MPTCVRSHRSPTCPGWLPLEPVVGCTPGPALAPSDGPARVRPRPAEPGCRHHPQALEPITAHPVAQRVTEPALLEATGQAQAGLDPLWPQPAHPNTCSELQTLIAPQSSGRDAPRPRDAPLCSGAERGAVGGAGLGAEPAHHVSSKSRGSAEGVDCSGVGGGAERHLLMWAGFIPIGQMVQILRKPPSSQAGSHGGKVHNCVLPARQASPPSGGGRKQKL